MRANMKESIVKHCAATLAGFKCGCIFKTEGDMSIVEEVEQCNKVLEPKGVFIIPLGSCGCGNLWYVYRPLQLESRIRESQIRIFLEGRGYDCSSIDSIINEIKSRLKSRGCIPHEIGILLDYPLEDVKAFSEGRKDYCCIGCWKVYGDSVAANIAFKKIRKCKNVYTRKFREGTPLEKLAINA